MKIAVIDGQGGGVGKAIVQALKPHLAEIDELLALGTNATATVTMLKSGASIGATGENAIIYNASRVDIIAGPIGIIIANALYGEISPKIASAVAESSATKVLIPIDRCRLIIPGASSRTLQTNIKDAVEQIIALMSEGSS
ncbi:DUF3842 family protein [Sediminispirochaeta smaragdinae]|jgi:hypothetical protein|uniref:DUF3842 family protein n=1 Tax=Sediminispirochaeta smaragdinae (strain DSM 11293 / JCM 15392 / SEBR 4228) TaxID=573413 RepID=E1R870_SEDSS|nr:DUF3842 family protein [Sediminispirochaeta smaragdinae]ADK82925.1 conserved hypothetical protein [Sediminispirochaeta smaragdinae DSM 11293]